MNKKKRTSLPWAFWWFLDQVNNVSRFISKSRAKIHSSEKQKQDEDNESKVARKECLQSHHVCSSQNKLSNSIALFDTSSGTEEIKSFLSN